MGACDEIREELSAYLDGELSQDARAACEAHVQACESCRNALADLRAASAAVAALPKLKAPAGLAARVRRQVSAQPVSTLEEAAAPALFWHPAFFAVAALVMLSLLAFIVLPALAGRMREGSVAVTTVQPKKPADRAPAAVVAPEAKQAPADAAAEKKPALTLGAARPDADGVAVQPALPEAPTGARGDAVAADSLKRREVSKGPPPAPATAAPPATPLPGTTPAKLTGAPPAAKAKMEQANGLDPAARTRRAVAGEEAAVQVLEGAIQQEKSTGAPPEANAAAKDLAAKPEAFRAKGKAFAAPDAAKSAPKPVAEVRKAEAKERKAPADAAKQVQPFEDREADIAQVDGAAGATRGAKAGGGAAPTTPPSNLALDKPGAPAAPEKQNRNAFAGRTLGEAAETEAPPPADAAPSQRPAGEAKGVEVLEKARGPAQVLVFRTQDPERLLSQLQELARQNGARCEMADSFGTRIAKKSAATDEKRQEPVAGKGAARQPGELEMVTTLERRGALLAQLRALQSAQPLQEELRSKRGAGGTAQAETLAPAAQAEALAQPAEPATAQKEKRDEGGQDGAQQQAAEPAREARILIRIETMPAK